MSTPRYVEKVPIEQRVMSNSCLFCSETDPGCLIRHHVIPRSRGGTDDPENIVTLCRNCHGKAHKYMTPITRTRPEKGPGEFCGILTEKNNFNRTIYNTPSFNGVISGRIGNDAISWDSTDHFQFICGCRCVAEIQAIDYLLSEPTNQSYKRPTLKFFLKCPRCSSKWMRKVYFGDPWCIGHQTFLGGKRKIWAVTKFRSDTSLGEGEWVDPETLLKAVGEPAFGEEMDYSVCRICGIPVGDLPKMVKHILEFHDDSTDIT